MGAPWAEIANQAAYKVHGLESAGVTAIANALDPVQQAEKKFLKRDIEDYKKGNLGYSQSQIAQMQQDNLQQIQNQSSAQLDAMNRQRVSNPGGSGGAYFAAQQRIAQSAQDASAKSRGQALQQSDVLAAQRAATIRARISAKAQENRAANAQLGEQLSGNDAAQKGHGFSMGGGGGGGGGMGGMMGGMGGASGGASSSSIPSGF